MPLDFSLLTSTVQQPVIPQQQPQQQPQQVMGGFPLLPPPPSSIVPPSQPSPFAAFPNLQTSTMASSTASPKTPQQQQQSAPASSPGSALQGFGLDVFGLGSSSLTAGTPPSSSNQQGSPLLGAKFGTGLQPGVGMGLQQPPPPTGMGMGMGLQQPVGIGMGQPQPPVMGMGLQQPIVGAPPTADPLAALNDLFVSLDSIQPGKPAHYTLMHVYTVRF